MGASSLLNPRHLKKEKMRSFTYAKWWIVLFFLSLAAGLYAENDIVIENAEMRLIISEDGIAKSLIHKSTGQECLATDKHISVFAIRQSDVLPSQEMLVYPAEPKLLPVEKVQRFGDRLKITFNHILHLVTVRLNITDSYIGFTVENIEYEGVIGSAGVLPPLDELIFLRLPIKERDNFGAWLNVMHDNHVAVNVLATNEYAMINSELRQGYRILQARAVRSIKSIGVGAALITTSPDHLLDRVGQLEIDYNLPPGVQNRRLEESKFSYYWPRDISPETIDRHIAYAKAGGFKLFMISSTTFSVSGHFSFTPEYKNGMQDLKKMVDKINGAGMMAGLHTFYSMIDTCDAYVRGRPDHRLNLRKIFTLAEPISEHSTTITVEEDPGMCPIDDGERFLKLEDEIISYQAFTTERPYQFTGCKRGQFQTVSSARNKGYKLGLLHVGPFVKFVGIDQRTSLPEEVAKRLGEIYRGVGFRFIYFDGAEVVNQPFWYYVSHAQKTLYDQLDPPPIFAEAALRSHFSWHITCRSNAFDLQQYPPALLKDAIRHTTLREAGIIKNDFTKLDFGWIANNPPGYWEDDEIGGVQSDMIEYSTSLAAGWETGTSLWTELSWSDQHPRTKDIFEVFKRWESVREKNWLSEEQKAELRDPNQEHILLINEKHDFELRPYSRILQIPTNKIRAFCFKRGDKVYVVYWHTEGEGQFKLPLGRKGLTLFNALYDKPLRIEETKDGNVVLPAADRRYLECTNLSEGQLIEAFQNLQLCTEAP